MVVLIWGRGASGTQWAENKDVAKHLMHKSAPRTILIQLKMPAVPKLKNLGQK